MGSRRKTCEIYQLFVAVASSFFAHFVCACVVHIIALLLACGVSWYLYCDYSLCDILALCHVLPPQKLARVPHHRKKQAEQDRNAGLIGIRRRTLVGRSSMLNQLAGVCDDDGNVGRWALNLFYSRSPKNKAHANERKCQLLCQHCQHQAFSGWLL